jgi:hypothetical protein
MTSLLQASRTLGSKVEKSPNPTTQFELSVLDAPPGVVPEELPPGFNLPRARRFVRRALALTPVGKLTNGMGLPTWPSCSAPF